jgi:L-amino acid N-acyltransferase YncA
MAKMNYYLYRLYVFYLTSFNKGILIWVEKHSEGLGVSLSLYESLIHYIANNQIGKKIMFISISNNNHASIMLHLRIGFTLCCKNDKRAIYKINFNHIISNEN